MRELFLSPVESELPDDEVIHSTGGTSSKMRAVRKLLGEWRGGLELLPPWRLVGRVVWREKGGLPAQMDAGIYCLCEVRQAAKARE